MSTNHRSLWRIIGLLAATIFVGSVIWSLWYETLLPFIKQENYLAVGFELVGFSIAWFGVEFMAYGGFIVIRNTWCLFIEDTTFQANVEIVQHRRRPLPQKVPPEIVRQARMENLRLLWRAWRPGLSWMALGWIVVALSGFFIALAEGKLSYR